MVHTASKQVYLNEHDEEKAASIVESAIKQLIKQLQSLAEFMPISDARTLALQLYYIELMDGISPIRARNKVSQIFLVSQQATSDLVLKRTVFAVNNTSNALSHILVTRIYYFNVIHCKWLRF